jgi:hypothetical protein
MQAKTIDEVIEALDAIIETAKKDNSAIGYFPALYRKVTKRVKEGIEKDEICGMSLSLKPCLEAFS